MQGNDKTLILEARIRVLVDKVAEQSATFDKMQNKMFAIIGLLLTLGGLLTYDAFKLNYPDTVIEYILFITALILIGLTAILIGYYYRADKSWSVPIGPQEDLKLDGITDYAEALTLIHSDYQVVNQKRDKSLERRGKVLNASLYMFIVSVIMLIVLKIGG